MSIHNLLYYLAREKPYFSADLPGFPSNSVRAAILSVLIEPMAKKRMGSPLRILEIGSWVGASTLAWAEGLLKYNGRAGHILCADIWHKEPDVNFQSGQVVSKNTFSHSTYDIFHYNTLVSGYADLVTPLIGDCRKTLSMLRDNYFDIIFVDSLHDYQHVCADIQEAQRLLAPGGILCGDDYEIPYKACNHEHIAQHLMDDHAIDPLTGKIYHPGVTKAVNEYFGDLQPVYGLWAVEEFNKQYKPFDLASLPRRIPDYFPDALKESTKRIFDTTS